VLANLLGNAIAYAPGTDAIDVRLRRTQELTTGAGAGEAEGGPPADVAELEVQDYGPGIPAEDLPQVFTRFYRIERAEGSGGTGLGLGLFIAREIVAAHGGRIEVRSREGAGTTFIVYLPAPAQVGSGAGAAGAAGARGAGEEGAGSGTESAPDEAPTGRRDAEA
jgi:two-component system CheB/CheR fusion protein